MKIKIVVFLSLLCLLLGGCSWLGGSYVNVTPHQEQRRTTAGQTLSASNYAQLATALEDMVADAAQSGIIRITNLSEEETRQFMEAAKDYICTTYPLGAYAVENMTYEIGTSGGSRAVAVELFYQHSYMEIQKVSRAATMEDAKAIIYAALEGYLANTVIWVEEYRLLDFSQLVQDYAEAFPEKIMEIPQVTYETYGTGNQRVLELSFTYENSRDDLREMQTTVQPVFEAAALYVSGDGTDYVKFSQLYSFLMKRFNYNLETSITPSYSLLHHGVGDCRSFAVVYAAMCRMAGLECLVITGTRDGEPWTWNIVKDRGHYYHVDLLLCSEIGVYWEYVDGNMVGYIWDYSAYPACPPTYRAPDETEPEETEPEETKPEKPTEPEKPVEPWKPTQPTEPEETTQPTEPEETTQPTEPSQPSWPWWPTEPTEPEETTEPTEPSQPSWPWWPTEPTEPEETTQPTEPSQPDWPWWPTEPTEPEETTEPTEPSQPDWPWWPTEPTEPEETTEPTEPSQTSWPWWPTEPTIPKETEAATEPPKNSDEKF